MLEMGFHRNLRQPCATEEKQMAHPPPYPGSNDDSDVRPNRGSATSASRWAPAVIVIAIVLILLVVVLHLSGIIGPAAH